MYLPILCIFLILYQDKKINVLIIYLFIGSLYIILVSESREGISIKFTMR